MSSNLHGLSVTKPVSAWNRPLKANFKDLFKALGKAVIDGALGKWDSVAGDVLDASVAVGLGADTGQVAWLLIYRSFQQAMAKLIEDNQELMVKRSITMRKLEDICDRLDLALEEMELRIDSSLFSSPKQLPIVAAMQPPFAQWLTGFVQDSAQALAMSARLPGYFVFALHEEWRIRAKDYECLKTQLDTPFTKATEREQAWWRYLAWLQQQIEQPMFLEAFGLKQVYVPLRAYYIRQQAKFTPEDVAYRPLTNRPEEKRIVVSLAEALHTWLANPDRDDAIRVICGGPGCGKSSFTRILAAKLAEQGHLPVLVVPLHQLELEADLVEAIATLIRTDPDRLLPPNPLEPNHAEPRLLLIFDGLDELAMQGKVGNEAAQQFVREVQKLVNRFNQRTPRLQVLLSGRDLSVQANSTEFRREGQILHILPYFVPEDQWESYEDDQKLLADDRRQFWWKQYGTVSDRGYIGLPTELQHDNLTEITAQPLLNYLVALSYRREHLNFAETSNLNQIYADLLDAIYERAWAGYQHPTLQNVSRENFGRILEEIALSSWHGDGRTTTVQDIEKHCDSSGLKKLLEVFQEGAKTGVTRLLTAFYFRQSGSLRDGDKTFEFTHKSFGEYLTARRIIRGIARIATELDSHQQDLDRGWDERDALAHWAALCGASEMDVYLFNFVCNEMQLHDPDQVARWQQVLAHLFGVMLRQGMPMERLTPRPDYHEENRQARHAEESLLAVLNACARHTNQPSKIEHPSPEAFGAWLVRIQGQRMGGENVLALSCLGFLNLENCILMGRDLDGAILDRAILDRAILDGAILDGAGLAYISWNAETSWRNVQGLKTAKNVPVALQQQLGLQPFKNDNQAEGGSRKDEG